MPSEELSARQQTTRPGDSLPYSLRHRFWWKLVEARAAAVCPGWHRRQLDVHGRVASQAMGHRDQQTVRDRVLASEQPAGMRRLVAIEHPGADTLELPGGVPGAKEGATSFDDDVHRGAGRMLCVAEDIFYYPDVMVVCPPEDDPRDDDALFEDAPCLVVEVTSPSTEAIDRREKMLAYRRILSLSAYLIVYQEALRVERHWRDESGRWWWAEAIGPEGLAPIPCPETELTLAQIYEGL